MTSNFSAELHVNPSYWHVKALICRYATITSHFGHMCIVHKALFCPFGQSKHRHMTHQRLMFPPKRSYLPVACRSTLHFFLHNIIVETFRQKTFIWTSTDISRYLIEVRSLPRHLRTSKDGLSASGAVRDPPERNPHAHLQQFLPPLLRRIRSAM